jgi:hypothetical protein
MARNFGPKGAPKRRNAVTSEKVPPERITRKLIQFDAETLRALALLAHDRMQDFQELADEAFADVLKKHHRPVTLKESLKQSARLPANDDG